MVLTPFHIEFVCYCLLGGREQMCITISDINAFMSNAISDCDSTKAHFYQQ